MHTKLSEFCYSSTMNKGSNIKETSEQLRRDEMTREEIKWEKNEIQKWGDEMVRDEWKKNEQQWSEVMGLSSLFLMAYQPLWVLSHGYLTESEHKSVTSKLLSIT